MVAASLVPYNDLILEVNLGYKRLLSGYARNILHFKLQFLAFILIFLVKIHDIFIIKLNKHKIEEALLEQCQECLKAGGKNLMGKIPLRSPKHMTALFSLHVYFTHSLAALKFNFTCFLSFHVSNLNCFCQNVEDFDWFSISFLIIFTSFSRQPSVRWHTTLFASLKLPQF